MIMAIRPDPPRTNKPPTPRTEDKRRALLKDTTAGSARVLTSNAGLPINDDQNSLKAGRRGPTWLQDRQLREEITHVFHERIPACAVHARGSGAHGYFKVDKIACVGDPSDRLAARGLVAVDAKSTPGIVKGRDVEGITRAFVNTIAAHCHWVREVDPVNGK